MEGRRICFPSERRVTWEKIEFDQERLKPSEMLIQTHYTLISAAAEIGLYSGRDWNWAVRYPRYPGYTNIGVVKHAGLDAKGVAVGDLVFTYANHASVARVDVNRDFYLKVPNHLDPKHALFVRLGSVAMTAPTIADYKPGYWVIVFGMGIVGNLAAQLFRLGGASIIGVDLASRRLEVARECGIPHTVNPDEAHLTSVVQTLTHGRGAEIVVDAIGNAECVIQGLDLLRRGGQVLLLGQIRESSDALASDLIRKIFLKWATVKSSWEWQLPQWSSDQIGSSIEDNSRIIFEMLQDGRLHVEPLISHVITPDEIPDAYEGLINRRNDYWGVVIDWTRTK